MMALGVAETTTKEHQELLTLNDDSIRTKYSIFCTSGSVCSALTKDNRLKSVLCG